MENTLIALILYIIIIAFIILIEIYSIYFFWTANQGSSKTLILADAILVLILSVICLCIMIYFYAKTKDHWTILLIVGAGVIILCSLVCGYFAFNIQNNSSGENKAALVFSIIAIISGIVVLIVSIYLAIKFEGKKTKKSSKKGKKPVPPPKPKKTEEISKEPVKEPVVQNADTIPGKDMISEYNIKPELAPEVQKELKSDEAQTFTPSEAQPLLNEEKQFSMTNF